MAIQTHTVAKLHEDTELRLFQLEKIIEMLQTFSTLETAQGRYAILVECLAWDIHKHLIQYQGLFTLEREFNLTRPSPNVAIDCFNSVILNDIQNQDFKQRLLNLNSVWEKKDQIEYTKIASELDAFGETLSGDFKHEFDMYRMVLGHQYIVLPE